MNLTVEVPDHTDEELIDIPGQVADDSGQSQVASYQSVRRQLSLNKQLRESFHSLQLTKDLVEKGANINSRRDGSGQTATHLAADHGNYPVLSFLICNGADLNIKDAKGKSLMEHIFDGLKKHFGIHAYAIFLLLSFASSRSRAFNFTSLFTSKRVPHSPNSNHPLSPPRVHRPPARPYNGRRNFHLVQKRVSP
jgi:ankyrin repeat protein